MTKVCIKCAAALTRFNWWESRRKRRIYICISCHKACSTVNMRKRREEAKLQKAAWRRAALVAA